MGNLSVPLETQVVNGLTIYSLHYPNWRLFLRDAEQRTVDDSMPRLDCHSRHYDSGRIWTGTKDMDEALRLAQWGWEDGAKQLSKLTGAIFTKASSLVETPDIRYHEWPGAGIDMGRFLEGDPECFQHFHTNTSEGTGRSLLRLVFNGTASAAIKSSVMIAKGAAVAGLVTLLNMNNFGVQVDLVHSYKASARVEVYVTIKRADEVPDPLTLAMALAHPSTFRRLSFSVVEGLPREAAMGMNVGGNYGMPWESQEKGDIYVSQSTYGEAEWVNPKAAVRWVVKKLKEQGIELRSSAEQLLKEED